MSFLKVRYKIHNYWSSLSQRSLKRENANSRSVGLSPYAENAWVLSDTVRGGSLVSSPGYNECPGVPSDTRAPVGVKAAKSAALLLSGCPPVIPEGEETQKSLTDARGHPVKQSAITYFINLSFLSDPLLCTLFFKSPWNQWRLETPSHNQIWFMSGRRPDGRYNKKWEPLSLTLSLFLWTSQIYAIKPSIKPPVDIPINSTTSFALKVKNSTISFEIKTDWRSVAYLSLNPCNAERKYFVVMKLLSEWNWRSL